MLDDEYKKFSDENKKLVDKVQVEYTETTTKCEEIKSKTEFEKVNFDIFLIDRI